MVAYPTVSKLCIVLNGRRWDTHAGGSSTPCCNRGSGYRQWRGQGLSQLAFEFFQLLNTQILTDTGGVLATEVAGLVAADETGSLGLGSRATGKTSVEVHDALHAGSILGSTDGLYM